MTPALSCPTWSADADEHRSPACFVGAREAISTACSRIERELPVRADLELWHRLFFARVVPLDYYAGNCRQADAQRPCLFQTVSVGPRSGTPPQQVIAEFEQLLNALSNELKSLELKWDTMPHVDRAKQIAMIVGVAVGSFLKIHPFLNGNGRTSRLFWRALLHRFKIPPQVSVVTRPSSPYGNVMAAAMAGDFSPAIIMILSGLTKALGAIPARLEVPRPGSA